MDDVGMFEVFPVLFWSSGNEFNGGCGVGYKANARWSLRRSFTDMKRGHHAAAGCLRQQARCADVSLAGDDGAGNGRTVSKRS
jgi:hypothetical protein